MNGEKLSIGWLLFSAILSIGVGEATSACFGGVVFGLCGMLLVICVALVMGEKNKKGG